VWNIAAPLELGRVYTMAGDASHGYFLMPGSDVFVEQTKSLSQSSTYNVAWSETRSGAWNVNAQLTYMGLRGDAAFKNVRSVGFSLTGDQYAFVNNAAGFDNLINLPTFGPALRKKILEDTLRLKAAGLAARNAKYWIAVQLLTAKNLTVDFTNSTSASAGTDVVDPSKLAGWLNVQELSPAKASVSHDGTSAVKYTAPGSMGLVAQCVPLLAHTEGPEMGSIYFDDSAVLDQANFLRAR
jgi:hypothetical protein